MSWKSQGGNKKNRNIKSKTVLFSNSNFWERGSGVDIYNLNDGTETRVGIGTSAPFSRLSFGDTSYTNTNIGDNSGNFALCETSTGVNATGIGYYEEFDITGDLEYTGIKFVVNKNSTTNTMNTTGSKNVKMLLTNDGRLLINKDPRVETIQSNYRIPGIDVSGSIHASQAIILDEYDITKQLTPIPGSIYYDGSNLRYIKKDGSSLTLEVVGGVASEFVSAKWSLAGTTSYGLYKSDANITIFDRYTSQIMSQTPAGQNDYYQNAFGVNGTIVSGVNHEARDANDILIQHPTTAMLKNRVLSETAIVDISNQGIIAAENNIAINTLRPKALLDIHSEGIVPYISAGILVQKTDISGSNVTLGFKNKNKQNYSIVMGNENNNNSSTHSLLIGSNNSLDNLSSTSLPKSYNVVIGSSNIPKGVDSSFIYGSNHVFTDIDERSKNNMYFGYANETHDASFNLLFGRYNRSENSSDSAVLGYQGRIVNDNVNPKTIFSLASEKKFNERGGQNVNHPEGGNVLTVNEEGDLFTYGKLITDHDFKTNRNIQVGGYITTNNISFNDNQIYSGIGNFDTSGVKLTDILSNFYTAIATNSASGTYYYYCENHPGMGGQIIVTTDYSSQTYNYAVSIVSNGDQNVYAIDGTQQATLTINIGDTIIFTLDDQDSESHLLKISKTNDGIHNGGTALTSFVNITETIQENNGDVTPKTTFSPVDNRGIYAYSTLDDFNIGSLYNPITIQNKEAITIDVTVEDTRGSKYLLNYNAGDAYNPDTKYKLGNNTYTLTGIPKEHPIAILNNGKTSEISYSGVDNTNAPIIIKVSEGSETLVNNDYYTFRDDSDQLIYIGSGSFKFMRGKTYEFQANGISTDHPFKIWMNGGFVSKNVVHQSVCLPTNTTLSIIDDSGNKFVLNGDSTYDANRKYGLINGTYTFTGIPKEHPIAILNEGQPLVTYNTTDNSDNPIIIKVAGGNSAAVNDEDYYTFTDASGASINIGGNNASTLRFMRGKTYKFEANGIPSSNPFKIWMSGALVNSAGINDSTCLTTSTNVGIVDSSGNKYVFNYTNGDAYDANRKYGLATGDYTFTNIPKAHPIALLNSGKTSEITYSAVDNSDNPIIINVAGGSETIANGDYYTFTDASGATINIGGNDSDTLKFMRGKTYKFQANGISTDNPFKIRMSGAFVDSNGINDNNCLTQTTAVGIVDSGGNKYVFNGDTTYTAGTQYGMAADTYTFIGIPKEHPIAILNSGKTSEITYSAVNDTNVPIIIKVAGGDTTEVNGDYYIFTDENDNVINIGGNDANTLRFMRGKTYEFRANGILSTNPFKLFMNGNNGSGGDFVDSNNTDVCLTTSTNVGIVDSSGNKYVFNYTEGDAYDANRKYGLAVGTYTFTNIPKEHPIAILNTGRPDISYNAVDNSDNPIIINVAGGDTTEVNGDYYTFTDASGTAINIGDGTFKFMRGKTYKFQGSGSGISTDHPFKIYMSGAFVTDSSGNTDISGSTNSITITIPTDHSTTAGDLYYQCAVHPGMKKDLSLFYKEVTGTTADASYNFFYGDVTVNVTGNFGDVSVYCFYHGYMGGENLLRYVETCINTPDSIAKSISGSTNSITITIPPEHSTTAGDIYYQNGENNNLRSNLSLLYKEVTETTPNAFYDFFYGDVTVNVAGNFGEISVYCFYHGYMGGENLLKYDETCGSNPVTNSITGSTNSITITIPADHSTASENLYYQNANPNAQNDLNVNLGLLYKAVTGTTANASYDFFYGDVNVTVTGNFGLLSAKSFNDADNYMSGQDLLKYDDTCGSNPVTNSISGSSNSITITIPADHSTASGDLYYQNGDDVALQKDLPLLYKAVTGTTADASYNFFYGDITVNVTGDFGLISVHSFNDSGNMGGQDLLKYDLTCDSNAVFDSISGNADTMTVTIPIDHSTNAGDLYYQCGQHAGMKKDLTLLYKPVTGTTADASYNFFYGDVNINVSGDFGVVSLYGYYDGYMGGENLFEYTSGGDTTLDASSNVSVEGGGSVKYIFNASKTVIPTFVAGKKYIFDQSDSSNLGYPLNISNDYQTQNDYNTETLGTAGEAGATVTFEPMEPTNIFAYHIDVDGFDMASYYNNGASGMTVSNKETVTINVTVVDYNGEKYVFDGNQNTAPVLTAGKVYIFDQSDPTNVNHPLRFSETNGIKISYATTTEGNIGMDIKTSFNPIPNGASFNGIAFSPQLDISSNIRDSSNNIVFSPGIVGEEKNIHGYQKYIQNPRMIADIDALKLENSYVETRRVHTIDLSATNIDLSANLSVDGSGNFGGNLYANTFSSVGGDISGNNFTIVGGDVSGNKFTIMNGDISGVNIEAASNIHAHGELNIGGKTTIKDLSAVDVSLNSLDVIDKIKIDHVVDASGSYDINDYYDTTKSLTIGNENETELYLGVVKNIGQTNVKFGMIQTKNSDHNLILQGTGGKVGIGIDSSNNPLVSCELDISGSGAIKIPIGDSLSRPGTFGGVASLGQIRFNTELQTYEGFGAGDQWGSLGGVSDAYGTKITPQETAGVVDNIMTFYTNDRRRMTINAVGRIGIATATPRFILDISSNDVSRNTVMQIPVGTTELRPIDDITKGIIRYNTTLDTFEGYGAGDKWGSLGGVSDSSGTFITAQDVPGVVDNNMRFFTNGVERVHINPYGNIKINNNFGLSSNVGNYTNILHNIYFNNNDGVWKNINDGSISLMRLYGGDNEDSSIRFYTSNIANNTEKDTVLAYILSLNYVDTWTIDSIDHSSYNSLAGLHYWLYDTGSEIIITNDDSNHWGPSKLTISQIQSFIDTLTEPYYIGLNKSNTSDSGSGNDISTFTSCEVFLRSKADMVDNGITFVDKVINGKTFSVPSNWNDDHIVAPAFTGLPEPFHTVGGGGRNAIYILDTRGSDEKDVEFQNERMRIDKEGNVGIGTQGPAEKLHVYGNLRVGHGNISTLQLYNGIHDYVILESAAQNGNITLKTGYAGDSDRDSVKIQAYGTSYFNGGNVGIGTDNPDATLSVCKSSNAGNDSLVPGVHIGRYDSAGEGAYINLVSSSNSGWIDFKRNTSSNTDRQGRIVYQNNIHQFEFETDTTIRMVINGSGKVGIGTNDPEAILSVLGPTTVESSEDKYWTHSTTKGIHMGLSYWNSNSWRDASIDITASNSTGDGRTGSFINFNVANNSNNRGVILYRHGDNAFHFRTNNTDRMTIDANGNVGIGTTDPDYKFHIDGTDAIKIPAGTTAERPSTETAGIIRYNTDLQTFEGYGAGGRWGSLGGVSDAGGTKITSQEQSGVIDNIMTFYTNGEKRMTIDPEGTVGIGTSDPSNAYILDISGSVNFTGNLYYNGGIYAPSSASTIVPSDGIVDLRQTTVPNRARVRIFTPEETGYSAMEFSDGSSGMAQDKAWLLGFNDGTNNPFQIKYRGDGGQFTPNAWHNEGSTIFTLNDLGNVGIGVSNPWRNLHVHKPSTGPVYFRLSTNESYNSGQHSDSGFDLALDLRTVTLINRENGPINFRTNNSFRMTIAGDGNVGIGTTSPDDKLTVNGDIGILDSATIASYGTDIGALKYIHNPGGIKVNVAEIVGIPNTGWAGSGSANDQTGSLEFRTLGLTSSSSSSGFLPQTRMKIDSDGKVGIGTTDPARGLSVETIVTSYGSKFNAGVHMGCYQDNPNSNPPTPLYSHITMACPADGGSWIDFTNTTVNWKGRIRYWNSANRLDFHTNGSGTPKMVIDANGNIGIGTNDPTKRLHIKGNGGEDASIKIESSDYNGAGFMYFQRNTDGKAYLLNQGSYPLILGANNSFNQLYLKEDGNVGFGTDNPATKLHIKSADFATFIKLERTGVGSMGISATNPTGICTVNGSGNFVGWQVLENGNVGIGTNSPQQKLHVMGNILLNGSSSVNSEIILSTRNNGTADKTSIKHVPGELQIYTDAWVKMIESDSNSEKFTFDCNTGNAFFAGNLTVQGTLNYASTNVYTNSVSFGTSNAPNAIVNIVGNSYPDLNGEGGPLLIKRNHSSAGTAGTIVLKGGGDVGPKNDGDFSLLSGGYNGGKFGICTGSNTYGFKFAIDTVGNVGIGTSEQNERLKISRFNPNYYNKSIKITVNDFATAVQDVAPNGNTIYRMNRGLPSSEFIVPTLYGSVIIDDKGFGCKNYAVVYFNTHIKINDANQTFTVKVTVNRYSWPDTSRRTYIGIQGRTASQNFVGSTGYTNSDAHGTYNYGIVSGDGSNAGRETYTKTIGGFNPVGGGVDEAFDPNSEYMFFVFLLNHGSSTNNNITYIEHIEITSNQDIVQDIKKTQHSKPLTKESLFVVKNEGDVGIGTDKPMAQLQIVHPNWYYNNTTVHPDKTKVGGLLSLCTAPGTNDSVESRFMRNMITFSDNWQNSHNNYNVSMRMMGADFDMVWNTDEEIYNEHGSNWETLGSNEKGNGVDNVFKFSRDKTAFMNRPVGIGTTDPQAKLDIFHSTNAEDKTALNLGIGDNSRAENNLNQITFSFKEGVDDYRHVIKTRHQAGTVDTENAIDFYLWKNPQNTTDIGNTHGMSITAGGVGIGTDDPDQKLDVDGNIKMRGHDFFLWDDTRGGSGTSLGRALVHYWTGSQGSKQNSVLHINYNADFGAGVQIDSKLVIDYGSHVSQGVIQTWKYSDRSFNLKCPPSNSASSPFIFQTGNAMEFQCDSNIGIHINEFGKVGIGTNDPQEPFHIKATNDHTYLRIESDVDKQSGVQLWDANNNWIMYIPSSSTNLQFFDGDIARVTFQKGGNVGIGTTLPLDKLDVRGNIRIGNYNSIISRDGNNNWGSFNIIAGNGSYTQKIKFHNDSLPHYMSFTAGNTERMRILSSNGNVGIGTNNPETHLHIKSDTATFSTDTPSKGIHMGCTWGGYDYDILINGDGDYSRQGLRFGYAGQHYESRGGIFYNNIGRQKAENPGGSMQFMTEGGNRMIINKDGRVGIGNLNPYYGLSINTNRASGGSDNCPIGVHLGMEQTDKYAVMELRSTSSSEINFGPGSVYPKGRFQYSNSTNSFVFYTNGSNERMRIDGNGNVGIGTTNPVANLTVKSQNRCISIMDSGQNNWSEIRAHAYNNLNSYAYLFVSSYSTIFKTNGSERMVINQSGNVGIGNTNPSYTLDVTGSARFTGNLTVQGTLTYNNITYNNYTYNGTATYNGLLDLQCTATNSGVNRGIRLWRASDSNWAIYMSESYAGSAANGGTAPSVGTITSHAIRFRSGYSTVSHDTGFIFENSNNEWLAAIDSKYGNAMFKGNVGIGTTNPGAKLEIKTNYGSGDYTSAIHIKSADPLRKENIYQIGFNRDGAGLSVNDSQCGIGILSHADAEMDSNSSYVLINHILDDAEWAVFSKGWKKLFRIKGESGDTYIKGNVGIGTNNPGNNLHIYDNTADGVILDIHNNDSTNNSWAEMRQMSGNNKFYMGVVGQGYNSNVDFNNYAFIYTQTSNIKISAEGTGKHIKFETNSRGSERMRIAANGNVGIGTTNPQQLLHLKRVGGHTNIRLQCDYDEQDTIEFMDTSLRWAIYKPASSTDLRFYNYSTSSNLLVLKQDNKVGIGTNDPKSALHVVGSLSYSPSVVGVHIGSSGPSNRDYGIEICSTSEETARSYIDFTTPGIDYGGRLMYQHADHSFKFYTNGNETERMRIDGNGNVGIGTTSPAYNLDVSGVINCAGFLINGETYSPAGNWEVSGSTGHIYRIAGNVGIGQVPSINYKLDVKGVGRFHGDGNNVLASDNAAAGVYLGARNGEYGTVELVSNENYDTVIDFKDLTDNNAQEKDFLGRIKYNRQTGFDIFTNGSERMRIDETGNVGISTTDPSVQLYIRNTSGGENGGYNGIVLEGSDGDRKAELMETPTKDGYLVLQKANAIRTVRIHSNDTSYFNGGNVGIGTTSPSTLLVVGEDGGGNATNTPGIHMKSTVGNKKCYCVGQDTTHHTILTYIANSTLENGYASLHTYGGNNDLSLMKDGGNVGIGTTDPGIYKLNVIGDINIQGTIYQNGVEFVGGGGGGGGGEGGGGGGYWSQNGSKIYYNSGNIGIGYNDPDYKLDIGGNNPSVDNTIRILQNNGGTAIRIGAGGLHNDITLLRVDGSSDGSFGTTDSGSLGFSIKYMGSRDANNNSLSIFSDNTNNQIEAFTMLQNGNIGIGTTDPGNYKLKVNGNMHVQGTLTYNNVTYTNNTYNGKMTVYGDINLSGQGAAETSNPKIIFSENSNMNPDMCIQYIGSEGDGATGNRLRIGSGNSSWNYESLTIRGNGYVGIGNDNPPGPLSVCATGSGFNSSQEIGIHMGVYRGSLGDEYACINLVSKENAGGWIDFTQKGFGSTDYEGRIRYVTQYHSTSYYPGFQFYAGGSHRMQISNTGNVGIGTGDPDEKLHIEGSNNTRLLIKNRTSGRAVLNLMTDNNDANDIMLGSNGQTRWSISGRDSDEGYNFSIWSYNGSWNRRFDIDHATGNVGIGTDDPEYKLDIYSDQYNTLRIKRNNSYSPSIIIATNNNNYRTEILGGSSQNSCGFSIITYNGTENGNTAFFIKNNGNVGIGTDNPGSYKLYVNGNMHVSGTLTYNNVTQNNITYTNNTYNGTATYNGLLDLQCEDTNSGVNRGIRLWRASDENWAIYMAESGAGRATEGTAVSVGTITSHAMRFRVAYQPSFTTGFIFENHNNEWLAAIRSDGQAMFKGNVGIGNDSPEAKLHINGQLNGWSQIINTGNGHLIGFTNSDNYRPGISFGRNMTDLNNQKARPNIYSYHHSAGDSALIFMHHRFAFYTTDRYDTTNREEKMCIKNNGYVGIGTDNPITTLDIRKSGGARLRLENSNTSHNYADQDESIEFCTDYATTGFIHQKGEDMRIGVTGSVSSIKFYTYSSTSSGYSAVSTGTQTQSIFDGTYTSSNDIPNMIIDTAGRVGIGTTNPNSSLHVVGPSNGRDYTPNYKGIHMGEYGTNDYAIEICAAGTANNSYIDFTTPTVDYRGRIIYRHSSHTTTNFQDSFAFYTAGKSFSTPDMIINKDGNVGIGTNNPASGTTGNPGQLLELYRPSDSTYLKVTRGNRGYIQLGAATNANFVYSRDMSNGPRKLVFQIGSTFHAMVIDTNYNVGIGTDDPESALHILGSIHENPTVKGVHMGERGTGDYATILCSNSSSNSCFIDFTYPSASNYRGRIIYRHNVSSAVLRDAFTFHTGGNTSVTAPDMIINKDGRVGIGTNDPGTKLHVQGDIRATGDITAYYSSDRRLKDNVKKIENPLEKLEKINGYTFEWKEMEDVHKNKGHDVGVIAQEIEEVLPEITATRENGYKAVRYEKLVPLLIECIKSQQNQINELMELIKNKL